MSKCLNCGEEFTPGTVVQKYCCRKCGNEYRRTHNIDDQYPSITFTCSHCGKVVVTEGGCKDKRTRFCSPQCEKKFWRHPHWEHESTNINFASIKQYESWEKFTNAQ